MIFIMNSLYGCGCGTVCENAFFFFNQSNFIRDKLFYDVELRVRSRFPDRGYASSKFYRSGEINFDVVDIRMGYIQGVLV